ncbi:phage terminase large subunit-like protein [Dyadobacter sp. BE34]|uniref:Phage terminase large subunit-like protein n=1 Tax=Dyadobacter fermentans TaxID=94254 RepID=A0ABU1QWN9_9BACT|nr:MULTISPECIES: terminase TerL endonuclease subunit [Dyadobacter]MDR6805560.1 phage terminase large subunit-like protein [Dyadobacter fermentans]MDR7042680.1 phage terminase large subunit-like protein [Dyadobacter sp. BE242]MDR7196992.1 phage terminase large subunit-like protein [Dyadobacter sp. BE34]MDR7215573.1 phage terminase large subunit-like protein [Dyadobacter sp. BE31]MDR7263109.1 phage terminase large subunit-like protein [Dyadobacter sp. BE32]
MANTLESGLKYAEDVRDGKIIVGELVRLAVKRHFKDLARQDGKTLRFNEALATFAISFFDLISLSKGETDGGKFECSPWQAFVVISLFGWQSYDSEKNRWKRRFREAYIEIPKKNGKTTFAAAIGLLLQFWDGENGPEIYSAAFTRDQAMQCFDEAKAMVERSPALMKHAKVSLWSVIYKKLRGKFMAVSHDKRTTEGKNPHGVILDEYHVHENDGVRNSLQTGMAARKQPIFFIITTAGDNKQGPCYKYREVCISVLKGKSKLDQSFILIYGIDKDDDWKDEKTWRKANPNLGISVEMDHLRGQFQQALLSGTKEVDFKTKHLNMWVDAAITWIPSETWDALARPYIAKSLSNRNVWYGGLDLGQSRDISSLAAFFPEEKFLLVRHYCSEIAAENAVRSGIDYKQWIEEGHLIPTPGKTTDYNFIKRDIFEAAMEQELMFLGYDPYSAPYFRDELTEELGTRWAAVTREDGSLNWDYYNKVQVFQQKAAGMAPATKLFEEMILNGEIFHDGNPITSWMLGNVAMRVDAYGNYTPVKDKSRDKIDGIIASIIAIGTYSKWNTTMGESKNDGSYGVY